MNIEKRIKEELLEAAGETDGADALVLLIGHEDKHAMSTIIGDGGDVLLLLTEGLEHALSLLPDELEKDLRMEIAKTILGGGKDASE